MRAGALLELGHALLAERPRDAHVVAVDLGERGGLRPVQGKERHRAAVLLERETERREAAVGRRHGDLHRSSLPDEAIGLGR